MKKIKNILRYFLSIIFFPFLVLFYNSIIIKVLKLIDPKKLNRLRGNYLQFVEFPKRFIPQISVDNSKIGIIVQGPLITEDDFTFETLKLYKKQFKNSKIVLSTWKDSNESQLTKIKSLGIKIILNDYPKFSGVMNLNYQIKTTKSAIKYLEGEVDYVAKTRTDTRIYDPESFINLINLIHLYNKENNRLIGIDINTLYKTPFSFSDMFLFGDFNTMRNYWDIDEMNKNMNLDEFNKITKDEKNFISYHNPEMIMMLNYLNKKDEIDFNIESYYRSLAKYFIVIDKEMISFYWFKYTNDFSFWSFKFGNNKKIVRHLDWIKMYNKYMNDDNETI